MSERFVIVVATSTAGARMTVEVRCRNCRRSVASHTFDLDRDRITHADAVAHGDWLAGEAVGHRCAA